MLPPPSYLDVFLCLCFVLTFRHILCRYFLYIFHHLVLLCFFRYIRKNNSYLILIIAHCYCFNTGAHIYIHECLLLCALLFNYLFCLVFIIHFFLNCFSATFCITFRVYVYLYICTCICTLQYFTGVLLALHTSLDYPSF